MLPYLNEMSLSLMSFSYLCIFNIPIYAEVLEICKARHTYSAFAQHKQMCFLLFYLFYFVIQKKMFVACLDFSFSNKSFHYRLWHQRYPKRVCLEQSAGLHSDRRQPASGHYVAAPRQLVLPQAEGGHWLRSNLLRL